MKTDAHESLERLGGYFVYEVQSADTLSGIASRLCGSAFRWPTLWAHPANKDLRKRRWNKPYRIRPGDKLLIPRHLLKKTWLQRYEEKHPGGT